MCHVTHLCNDNSVVMGTSKIFSFLTQKVIQRGAHSQQNLGHWKAVAVEWEVFGMGKSCSSENTALENLSVSG